MIITHDAPTNLAQTSEGAQELAGRESVGRDVTSTDVIAGAQRLRELGAVLRLSESEALDAELAQVSPSWSIPRAMCSPVRTR